MRPALLNDKTDLGTIILHWLVAVALVGAIVTGLKIAADMPNRDWMAALDSVLPRADIWNDHFRCGLVLIAAAAAYPMYVTCAGLLPRVRLDRVRLRALALHSSRWGAVNVMLHWLFYAALAAELMSGGLLYLDRGGAVAAGVHWLGMWLILAFVPLHLAAHFAFGRSKQLARVFHPILLAPARPRLDSFAMVEQLLQDDAAGQPPRAGGNGPTQKSDRVGHAPRGRRAHGNKRKLF
jgi:Ni,Fe-hydrogenase I cytochrome b subunit